MAYEYQKRIQMIIWDNEDYWCIDNEKESEELQEVYRKARLLDDVVATTKRRLSVQERKAKAFDHIKVIYDKNMNEMSISDAECIEMIGNELEGADDER